MNSKCFNELYEIGARFKYYPIADELCNYEFTTTRSKAWELESGHTIVKIKGHVGGVSVDHLEYVGPPVDISDTIYLQINNPEDEITWCSDPIHDDDVKYIMTHTGNQAYTQETLTPNEQRQLAKFARKILALPRMRQAAALAAVLGHNMVLTKECNDHRKARGFEPLPAYDPKGKAK